MWAPAFQSPSMKLLKGLHIAWGNRFRQTLQANIVRVTFGIATPTSRKFSRCLGSSRGTVFGWVTELVAWLNSQAAVEQKRKHGERINPLRTDRMMWDRADRGA